MSDNKLTCKPSDKEAANKCSSSHFDNPSEASIPPHAPNRRKSSTVSKKENVDHHDSQQSKTASQPSLLENQPQAVKGIPTEREDEKGESTQVSSGATHEDNGDKASQKLAVHFIEEGNTETVDEKRQSTPGSSGEKQGQGQKADEKGQSIPTVSGEEKGEKSDNTGHQIPTASGEEKGEKADETGPLVPNSSVNEHGETAGKTGDSNPVSSGEGKEQKGDETGQSIPNSPGKEQGEAVNKTEEPNSISPGDGQGQKEDEKGQPNPMSPGEEQGQKEDETGQPNPIGENEDETEESYPFNSEEEADETGQSFPASSQEESGGDAGETEQPFPIYDGEEYGEGADETGQSFPIYDAEEYDGEGADEARESGEPQNMPYGSSSPPPLYDPLGQQIAPPETKNILNFTPFVLPAWAEEFKATHCVKTNDSAYRNSPFQRRYYSTQVYFSRCCESGSHFYGNRSFNESYCNELLRKYREPYVSFTKEDPSEDKKEIAPTPTPKPSTTKTAKSTANIKQEEEEPGCCKCCCCCECCCKWYSWIIWLILLINVLVLVYIIWWEGCGLVVLVFDDMTNWEKYNFFRWANDILGLDYLMQLFLSFLGYFAYFFVVSCCYIFCKKCTIPDDPRSICSCKEVKVIIHIIYGAVMIVLLYVAIDKWKNNRHKFKGEEQARIDEEIACLQMCLIFTFAILIIGVVVYVIYSVERRKIRKRIHPETGNTQNEQNRGGGGMSNRPYSAPVNGPPGPGNDAIPASMIIDNVCGETVAPIMFPRPMRRAQSFTNCGFSHEIYEASTLCTD